MQTHADIAGVSSSLKDVAPGRAVSVLYGNNGNLLAVNESRHFGNVSSMDLSLIALPSAEMYGTLWVRPAQGDPIDEDECLDGLGDDLIYWNLANHPYAGRQIVDARMSWILGIASYGELYHLNVLHPEAAGMEMPGSLHTFDRFDNNLRLVFANQKFNLVRIVMPDPSRWRYRQVTSSVYFLYPNVIMMLDSFGVYFLRIFPLQDSPSKARTVHTLYIKPSIKGTSEIIQ